MVSQPQDTDLVRSTLQGDRTAFSMLVERYEKALYNAALRITGHHDDALDATQSAFLKAYSRLGSYDTSRKFFSWLFKIAINESLDLAGRRRTELDREADEQIADLGPDPETNCSAIETGRAIHRALSHLTPEHRAVVVLRHLHGLSYRDISEVIGVPEKTVKSRLFSGRRELREILSGRDVQSA